MDTPNCTIPLEAEPLDCAVSPSSGLLAAALVTGQLQLASFSCPPHSDNKGSQLAYQLHVTVPAPTTQAPSQTQPSKKKQKKDTSGNNDKKDTNAPSCRAVCFSGDGAAVLAGYEDCVVRSYDVSTGRPMTIFADEHDAQLSRVFAVAPHVFASGDEEGLVLLWDARIGGATYRYKQHTDYVTDFALHEKNESLVVTSGDATLSVHDIRKGKIVARSEDDNDDELLSCVVVKGGRKVVAGTQSGVLHLYSWGHFNDCSDRFPGHPEAVQALVAFDDETLLTGSSDGGVRVVGVLPNRLLGILGQHNEDFPVERLALSSDRRVLASTSHDAAVKLWDLSILHDDGDDGDGNDEEDGEGGEDDIGGDLSSGAMAAAAAAGPRRLDDKDEDVAELAKRRALRQGEEGSDPDDKDEDEDESEDEEEDEDPFFEEEGELAPSEDDSSSDDGDGAMEGDKGGKELERGQGGGTATGAKAQWPGGKAATAAGGVKALTVAAASGSGGKAWSNEGSEDDDEEEDSDGDAGGKWKKKPQRERTKWTKGLEQKKKPAGNFFADLL